MKTVLFYLVGNHSVSVTVPDCFNAMDIINSKKEWVTLEGEIQIHLQKKLIVGFEVKTEKNEKEN